MRDLVADTWNVESGAEYEHRKAEIAKESKMLTGDHTYKVAEGLGVYETGGISGNGFQFGPVCFLS